MYVPSPIPWSDGETLGEHLESRGISRRQFLEFCGSLAAVLGLNSLMVPQIAQALQSIRRPSVVWIQLQECTGCVESVLRTAEPTIGNLVLDLVSLDYSHTLMAASGTAAEQALQDSMRTNAGKYLLLVTGSVPLEANGIYTTIGGRTAKEVLEEAAKGAAAVIAIGACAHWGSVQAARPNPTGAVEHVWDYDFGGDARVLETYVSYLRKKLDAHGAPLIQTVRGVGYALRPPRT